MNTLVHIRRKTYWLLWAVVGLLGADVILTVLFIFGECR